MQILICVNRSPSRVVHSKLKDSDVNRKKRMTYEDCDTFQVLSLAEEANMFNILMGKEEHFVKDL